VSASDLFSIEGKTALVTGGGRGIGEMIARGFVEAGVRVYISSRKAETIDGLAAELSKVGTCVALPANLSTEEECRRLADEVAGREGSLNILVNNAGATWGAPMADFDDAAWNRVLDLNVKGLFHLTRFLVPALEAAGTLDDPARVINLGSIGGLAVPSHESYSYSASKAAVHHMTRVLAHHLGPKNITVNAIAPGAFPTKMMASSLAEHGPEIEAAAAIGRIGRPDDMAGTAIFLSSRAGSYLTGTVIEVDGGTSQARALRG